MKALIKNPHPFDMSSYFTGETCVLGGRDFERDEKEQKTSPATQPKKNSYELDWSFLKTSPGKQRRP